MSLGDAYADAHLSLESLNADISQASGMLESAVERWQEILHIEGTVDIDAAAATALIEQVASEWGAIIDSNLNGVVDIDTGTATAEVAAAAEEWQTLIDGISTEVDLDTSVATDELATAVIAWREALAANLNATVTMNTAPADDRLAESLLAWYAAVRDDLPVGVVMNTDAATVRLAAAVEEWRAIVSDRLTAEVGIDTEATTGKLLLAVEGWQALLTDAVTATVDMDTTSATDRLNVAIDEWNTQVGDGIGVGVDMDTGAASDQLAIAVEEWHSLVDDASLTATTDMDTTAASERLAASIEEWRSLAGAIPVSVDMDTGEATAHLAASIEEWHALTVDAISARADMDTATATDQLVGAVEAWQAIVADDLVVNVDMDTDGADDHLIESMAAWRTRGATGITVNMDLDTGTSGPEFEAQLAEWRRLATINVQVDVDDADSLANLAATFTGLRPLTDLPVRFHLDQPSVIAATAEVEALAAAWSDALDLNIRPSTQPQGDNDLPNRPGDPARQRGPPGQPTIRPQVDGTDAEVQARLLDDTLETILKVTASLKLDGDAAIPEAEAIRETVARLSEATLKITADGEGVPEYAETLIELVNRVLAQAEITPGVNADGVVPQLEALRGVVEKILALDIPIGVDDAAAIVQAQAAIAEIEATLHDVTVGIRPEVDKATPLADAKLLNKLFEDVLKVVIPAKFDNPAILAKAETLSPLIKEALRVVSEVGIDGAGAVPAAEALGRVLSQAVDITAPVKIGDKEAIAKLTALDGVFQGLIRDLHVKIGLNGGEVTAEMAVLLKVLGEQRLHVKAELDKAKALADGILFNKELHAVAGVFHLTPEIDSASLRGRAAGAGLVKDIEAGFKSIFPDLSRTVSGLFAGLFDNGTSVGGQGLTDLFTGAAEAGGILSGVIDELGINGAKMGKSLTAAGEAGAEGLSALGSGLGVAAGLFAKLIGVVTLAGLALAGITTAAAAATAGIFALLAAAGGLIGLAAGFATLAGGIGLAAGAAGVLGIALNKDLLEQVKTGLNTLKDNVAAATRDVGQQLIDKFQAPFIQSFSSIAAHAAKLTPLLVNPIAEAGLRITRVFDGILSSDVGASIASKLGTGIGSFIDQFAGYLPAYAQMVDQIIGQTSGLHDLVQAVLELGLQAAPLFLAIGRFISGLSKEIQGFGAVGIPIVERIFDSFTKLVSSDLFDQFLSLGVVALNGILDVFSQITEGMKSAGLGDIFNTIGQVVQEIVSSGIFTRLGEMIGELLDMGANVLGPIFEVLVVALNALLSALEPVIPTIEAFVTVLADNLVDVIQKWVDDGVFDQLARALQEILNAVTFLIPPLSDLLEMFGPALAKSLSFIADLFGDYLPRAIGFFAEAVVEVQSFFLDTLSSILDGISGAIGLVADLASAYNKVAQFTGQAQIPTGVIDSLRLVSSAADDMSGTLSITAQVMDRYVAPGVRKLGQDYADLGSAADRTNSILGFSNEQLDHAAGLATKYGDVLGDGVTAINEYGIAHGFTETQIDAAAQAASDAAEQFQYTTGLVSALREEASKPIVLAFDFDKTKLNLDKLVKYVDTQVKTVRDNASKPINTDPTTEALASQVIGADGTALNEATSQSQSHDVVVPEHLETSIADATQELLDNAARDVDNSNFLKELEFNGFSALADQLRTFDGPKLELAIQELGNSSSAAVREANRKIKEAQTTVDINLNPLQAAIDTAKKEAVLKFRQVDIVKELEGKGFSNLASQFAAIKPEDLEAAIRTYESIGGIDGPVVAGMEKQLKDLRDALSQRASEVDPIGKMWEAAANTPGAQEGLIGKILTPEQIEAAIGDNFDNHFTANQQGIDKILDTVGAAIQSAPGTAAGDMTAEQVDRWRNLLNGFDPKTGKPVENVTDEEAATIAALKLRQAQGKGQTVLPDGTITAGQAEATTAGAAVATAFAKGMTDADGSKLVEDAGNSMVTLATNAITANITKAVGTLIGDGSVFAQYIASGIDLGTILYIAPAAIRMLAATLGIIDTALSGGEEMIGTGRIIANSLALGVTAGATTTLYPAIILMTATILKIVTEGITGAVTKLLDSGKFIPNTLSVGVLLGLPTVLTSLKTMGDLMVAMIEAESKRSAFAANLMGQAIGNAIGEGLKSSIAKIGLSQGEDGGGKEGGGIIGGAKGRGAADKASDAAANQISGPGVNIGSAIVDGMIAGMNARLPDLIKATQAIGAMLAAIMRASLGVSSPSKVTMTIGEQVAEGLARGIENGNDRVVVSARQLGDRVASAVNDGVGGIDGQGLTDGVTTMLGKVGALKPDLDFSSLTPSSHESLVSGGVARPGGPQWPESVDRAAMPYPWAPPSVQLPAQTALIEALHAYAGAPQGAQGQPATPGAPGTQTPAQALLAGANGGKDAMFLVQGDLNINGVPGAAELPQRVDGEMWRIGYGQNPRRPIS